MTKKEVEQFCREFLNKLPFGLKGYIILVERINICSNTKYEARNLSNIELLSLLQEAQITTLARIIDGEERVSLDLDVKTGTTSDASKP